MIKQLRSRDVRGALEAMECFLASGGGRNLDHLKTSLTLCSCRIEVLFKIRLYGTEFLLSFRYLCIYFTTILQVVCMIWRKLPTVRNFATVEFKLFLISI